MTLHFTLTTRRLELIPATLPMLTSERNRDYNELGRLTGAVIPPGWPPPLLDEGALDAFIDLMTTGSDLRFCSWYWIRTGALPTDRTLIGSGGTVSGAEAGDVLIGYSVLDGFQGQGYATEAVESIIHAVFADRDVRRILASTFPHLKASIRVLEKCGFVPAGECHGNTGMEEGTLLFVRERDASDTK
ncbi:MAG: GNAT family N-acetyltransferase [Methanomicrobiales archaeon]|nr:GNAT family N-acetyltransferase [Methanomicrobiales archaeon]